MLASDGDGDSLPSHGFSLADDIVELIVLTADEAFLHTLRDAVGNSRRVWHVSSADQVGDLLVAGQVGILVVDGQALHGSAQIFIERIKGQFPDLVLMAAGDREDESAIARLISAGAVHRFIHKPVSPARARLFADAAVRKFTEYRRQVAPTRPARGPLRRPGIWLLTGALLLAAALLVLVTRENLRHEPPSRNTPARQAARGGGEAPGGMRDAPTDAAGNTARAAEDDARERLLMSAETALLEERLDQAAAAIAAAREAGVESGRIAFLMRQLASARERQKLGPPHHSGRDARTANTKPPDRLEHSLELAAVRLQEGRLAEPDGDSANFYVREALRIDPGSAAAVSTEETLALALLSQAHVAIDRRDFARAVSLLDAADGIASPTNVDNLLRQLRTARRQAASERSRAAALGQPQG